MKRNVFWGVFLAVAAGAAISRMLLDSYRFIQERTALRFWEDDALLSSGNMPVTGEEVEGEDGTDGDRAEAVLPSLREGPLHKTGRLPLGVHEWKQELLIAEMDLDQEGR